MLQITTTDTVTITITRRVHKIHQEGENKQNERKTREEKQKIGKYVLCSDSEHGSCGLHLKEGNGKPAAK